MLDNNSASRCDHCRIPESKDLKSSRQDHELQHKNLERVEIRFSNAAIQKYVVSES